MDYILFANMDKQKRIIIAERANEVSVFIGLIFGILAVAMFGYSLGLMHGTDVNIISRVYRAFLSISPFGMVMSAFYAVDRVASYLQFWKEDYEKGNYILADRYATSNIIYQMSKLDKSQWDSFIDFQQDFEYNKLEVPKPDLIIYLDVEPEVSQKLMSKRYNGDESKKDLHEKNVNFLLNCRKSALYAAQRLGWKKISCTKDGEMRTIEDISADILKLITE